MDVTSRYRAKYPPKEHEEAVRMLLEGLKSQNTSSRGAQQTSLPDNNKSLARRQMASEASRESTSSGYDYDQVSFSSAEMIAKHNEKQTIQDENILDDSPSSKKMQSIGTITESDPSVSSGAGSGSSFIELTQQDTPAEESPREQIPSRTIAVQCDLKVSSVRQRDYLADGSMQASSISSTRYGFYNYSPETLERRRRLQRSVSSRDIRNNREFQPDVNFAPNQFSLTRALSSSSSCISGNSEEIKNHRKANNVSRYGFEEERADGLLSGSLNEQTTFDKSRYAYNSRPQTSDERAKACRSSTRSPSKVKHEEAVRASTLSQLAHESAKVATTRRQLLECNSNSESELEVSLKRDPHLHRYPVSHDLNEINKDEENPRKGSIMLNNNRAREEAPSKPPRPTLVSSSRNEYVQNLNDLHLLSSSNENYVPKRQRNVLPAGAHSSGRESRQSATMSRVDRSMSLKDRNWASGLRLNQQHNHPNGRATVNSLPRKPARTQYKNIAVTSENSPASSTLLRNSRPLPQYSATNKQTSYEKYGKEPIADQTIQPRYNYPVHSDVNPLEFSTLTRNTYSLSSSKVPQVERSVSMRQIDRTSDDSKHVYTTPTYSKYNHKELDASTKDIDTSSSSASLFASRNPFNSTCDDRTERTPTRVIPGGEESEDSESPMTRTWASPAYFNRQNRNEYYPGTLNTSSATKSESSGRKAKRSQSMRDVNNIIQDQEGPVFSNIPPVECLRREPDTQARFTTSYTSSSDDSFISGTGREGHRFISSAELDYDSQHRLNESGLPDPGSFLSDNRPTGASSFLGLSRNIETDDRANSGSHRRPVQVTGRAMSQQSLTRPSMPLMTSKGRRRGSRAGSDVGGSSMSLVSRLNGRYEDAHTRAPVVMYIPQAPLKSGDQISQSKAGTLRKSSRLRQRSQDRTSRKSLSRNGSDSESSSMLRTLVKPRSKLQQSSHGRRSSRRQSRFREDYDEDMDEIGQLATEIDSYKFRRRYSVPKDAKINWFAKLKQRVSSTVK